MNLTNKSEFLLIASSLLVVKAKKNISEHNQNVKNIWKQSSAIKQLLEALLHAVKMCTSFTKDIAWVNSIVCSVTSKPT